MCQLRMWVDCTQYICKEHCNQSQSQYPLCPKGQDLQKYFDRLSIAEINQHVSIISFSKTNLSYPDIITERNICTRYIPRVSTPNILTHVVLKMCKIFMCLLFTCLYRIDVNLLPTSTQSVKL